MSSVVAALPVDPEVDARAAFGDGDHRRTLTLLMRLYGDDIYRYCHNVMRDPALAEDVHQTVFVQAFRDLASFEGKARFRTWLYRIAYHRCLDGLKLRRRWRRRFAITASVPERPDPRLPADEQLERAASAAALEAALGSLPPKVRSAVLLRYREELSFQEMAAVSGEQAATLQARVARALPRLRQRLTGEDPA